jgi:hypothetical protein
VGPLMVLPFILTHGNLPIFCWSKYFSYGLENDVMILMLTFSHSSLAMTNFSFFSFLVWLIPIRFLTCEPTCYILGSSGFFRYAFGGGLVTGIELLFSMEAWRLPGMYLFTCFLRF